MQLTRIEKIGDSAALLLTDEMLDSLGIDFGDEVEVTVADGRLVVQSLTESEPRHGIEKATENVFRRRESAYRRLAEGVSEE